MNAFVWHLNYIWNFIVVLMEDRIWDFKEHAFAIRQTSGILFIVYGNDATQALLDHVSMIFLINEVMI